MNAPLHTPFFGTTIDCRYTSYVNSWFVDSVNWNSKQTRAFDELPGMQRARLSRQDTGEYTRTLEAMLRERGVDLGEVESTYFYDAQDLTKPSSKQREKEMY